MLTCTFAIPGYDFDLFLRRQGDPLQVMNEFLEVRRRGRGRIIVTGNYRALLSTLAECAKGSGWDCWRSEFSRGAG